MKLLENHVMKNSKIRIILDTNLWISFLITKNLAQIDSLLFKDKVTLLFSQELINEFIDVTTRSKLKKYFSDTDIEKLIKLFDTYGTVIHVIPQIKICRDEKDNFLLDLAVQGNADYLITSDKDLLTLSKIEKTLISTFSDYINSLK